MKTIYKYGNCIGLIVASFLAFIAPQSMADVHSDLEKTRLSTDLGLEIGSCDSSGRNILVRTPSAGSSKVFEVQYWDHSSKNWQVSSNVQGEKSNKALTGVKTGYFYRVVRCEDELCETSQLTWLPALTCKAERTQEALKIMAEPIYAQTTVRETPMRFEVPKPGEMSYDNIVHYNMHFSLRALWSMPPDSHGLPALAMTKPEIPTPIRNTSFMDHTLAVVYSVYQHTRTRGAPVDLVNTALDPSASRLFAGDLTKAAPQQEGKVRTLDR